METTSTFETYIYIHTHTYIIEAIDENFTDVSRDWKLVSIEFLTSNICVDDFETISAFLDLQN